MHGIDIKIGIWGLGLVGESLIDYLAKYDNIELVVYDHKPLANSPECRRYTQTNDLEFFLQACDIIFPSPGVDLSPYVQYQAKFRAELDLFYLNWRKSIIAITGTLGKTTLTTVLTNILQQAGINSIAAGNIGLPMCTVLEQDYTQVVLELSSFQLDLCTQFAPDLAIWTNFYDNHLDRHKTLANYFNAKAKIFLQQSATQVALLPVDLIPNLINFNVKISSQVYFFALSKQFSVIEQAYIDQHAQGAFYLVDQQVMLHTKTGVINIGELNSLSIIETYPINLLILLASLYLIKVAVPAKLTFTPIAHRVEKFMTHNAIDWYNDSKSTVAQATLAALSKLAGRPIILFLGGVSKGVDRSGLIQALKNRLKLVICFGGEADILHELCLENQITSCAFTNLEQAVDYAWQVAQSNDQVLFSPAGASFDLFKNYIERGQVFKQLVQAKIS